MMAYNSTYLEIAWFNRLKKVIFPQLWKLETFIYKLSFYFHIIGKMFLENVFGSKAKVKILRVLAEVRTAYSLKELVKETGLSLSITHKAAEELAEENVLIKIKGTRKERLYKFNAEGSLASPLFELFRTEKTQQRGDVIFLNTWNVLEQMLTKIKEQVDLVILFGSQVRGNATLRSDVDVLIVPKGKSDDILEEVKGVDKRISPLFLDLRTFKSDIKNKTPFYNSIKQEGLILFARKETKKELREFFEERGEK